LENQINNRVMDNERESVMRIYLVGVSCVGKSTIGKILADKLSYNFADFDLEIPRRMGESIKTIQSRNFNGYGFREEVSHILSEILEENKDHVVIAMPPSGMYGQYLRVLKKNPDVLTITIKDKAKNILERLVFYDDDNEYLIQNVVNDNNRQHYYQEIKEDIEYFYTTHRKTKMKFNIAGRNAEESAEVLFFEIREKYMDEKQINRRGSLIEP